MDSVSFVLLGDFLCEPNNRFLIGYVAYVRSHTCRRIDLPSPPNRRVEAVFVDVASRDVGTPAYKLKQQFETDAGCAARYYGDAILKLRKCRHLRRVQSPFGRISLTWGRSPPAA